MAVASSNQEAQLHWLALHLVPGLGARNGLKLIRTFGDPLRVFHASLSELRGSGLNTSVAETIHSGVSFEDAAAEAEKAKQAGIEIVSFHDRRYPERLKEIFDPPILLYVRGQVDLLQSESVAIVGARRPTPYGRAVAEKISRQLASRGLVIVSGMARGIDSAAHRGALEAGERTAAVMGCGVNIVYPKENGKLADSITNRGVIVSEFPIGSPPFAQNFPIRNRLISGLSLGVAIVEAAQYSGSLITARLALDQGREVFAVPGNVTSKLSWGPNLLIRQGATLIQNVDDIIEELPASVKNRLAKKREAGGGVDEVETSRPHQASLWKESVSPLAKELLGQLQIDTAIHIDEIIQRYERQAPSEILSALGELELSGLVRQLPGKYFLRIWS